MNQANEIGQFSFSNYKNVFICFSLKESCSIYQNKCYTHTDIPLFSCSAVDLHTSTFSLNHEMFGIWTLSL